MNLLFPRSGAVLLILLVFFIGFFGVGATLGAAEANAGNPTPMANDSVPPLQETIVSDIRQDLTGPTIVETAVVNMAKTGVNIAIVGIAVGHTSVRVIGVHLTQFWVEAIPYAMVALTAAAMIQYVQEIRVRCW